jgi:hypothetical protein
MRTTFRSERFFDNEVAWVAQRPGRTARVGAQSVATMDRHFCHAQHSTLQSLRTFACHELLLAWIVCWIK